MVKDLWSLRLQLLKNEISATFDEETVFSSQPQTETETENETETESGNVERVWKIKEKKMPTLIETLGLCYLGMILLRLPVSMGDIYRFVARI